MLVKLKTMALVVGLAMVAAAPANAAKLHASCKTAVEDETEDVICQIRSSLSKQPESVSAELSSGRALTGEVEAYQWTRNRSAWYYLVQKSGASSDEFRRMVEFLGRAAFIVGRQSVGVGTFTDTVTERANQGSFRTQLDRVYRDLGNERPDSGTPSMMKAAREGIEKLKDYEADRKAIVLLVNGTDSGSGPSRQEIVDLSREHGIVIYPVYFSDKSSTPPDILNRLADDTGGQVVDYSGRSIDEIKSDATNFSKKLENGSIMTISAAGLPKEPEIIFTANYEDDGELRSDAVRVVRQTDDPWHVGIGGLVADNLITILAVAGLGLGAILVLTSVRRSRARASHADYSPGYASGYAGQQPEYGYEDESGNDATVILGAETGGGGAFAWLELLDEDLPPIPVTSKHVRIGRHKDNDLRFTNSSVHRQHATLDVVPNGRVVIRDLDTRNGVVVNGTRYEERELADSDVIELGEVRLRFRAAI